MSQSLRDIDLLGHYRRWREGAGAFEAYVRATLFVSLKHYPYEELIDEEGNEGEEQEICERLPRYFPLVDGKNTLFLVDLPGQLALSVAKCLNNYYQVKPILLMHQPLHPRGLVGDRQFVQRLLRVGDALQSYVDVRGFVLVLDYQRFGEYGEADLQQYFNNQYELSEEDLPEAELLRHLGYSQVHLLTENPIKADLANYLAYLEEQGIVVEVSNYTVGML